MVAWKGAVSRGNLPDNNFATSEGAAQSAHWHICYWRSQASDLDAVNTGKTVHDYVLAGLSDFHCIKMNRMTRLIWAPTWQNQRNECARSRDSDQPGHLPSLIRVFAVRMKKLGSLATHLAHSEDSDQTGQMPRLSWVFAGRTLVLLVLSCHGSFVPIYGNSMAGSIIINAWCKKDWNCLKKEVSTNAT